MAHSHVHDHAGRGSLTTEQTRRLLAGAIGLVALLAVIGTVVLWPDTDRPELSEELGLAPHIVDATVTEAIDVPCAGTASADGVRCFEIVFDVTSGPTAGDEASFEIPITEAGVRLEPGDRVTLGHQPDADPGFRYFFNDYQRDTPLAALVALFVIAVLALGRFQGLRALVALGVTGVVMVGFMFPSILDGNDPTAVAIVAAIAIAIVALYLTHGVTEMITVALLGTFAALLLTALLAWIFTDVARFTGFATEDAFYLTIASADVDVRGLVLAGIIIGSLGVMDDVTVTQVSAVWQLHEANPRASTRRVYRSALVIGRDHIASTVNTLVLAYAGASLPLLLLFTQAGRSLRDVAVGELVAVEIVRTLVGSIGLVAAVPLTTLLAAFVVTRGSSLGHEPAGVAASRAAKAARRGGGRESTTATKPARRPTETTSSDYDGDWEQFAPKDDDW